MAGAISSLQPSVPLQTAQDILDQPVQPQADAATYQDAVQQQQDAQDEAARQQQSAALTTFFQNTFAQLQAEQDANQQAQQDAIAQQQAQQDAAAASNATVQQSADPGVDVMQPVTSPDQSVTDTSTAIPSDVSAPVAASPPVSAQEVLDQAIANGSGGGGPVPVSPPSGDQTATQEAQSSGGGGGGLFGKLGDIAGGVKDAATAVLSPVGHAVQSGIEAAGTGLEDLGNATGFDPLATAGLYLHNTPAAAAAFKHTFSQDFRQQTGEDLNLWTTIKALNTYGLQPIQEKINEATDEITGHTVDPIVNQTLGRISPDAARGVTATLDRVGEFAPYVALAFFTGGATLFGDAPEAAAGVEAAAPRGVFLGNLVKNLINTPVAATFTAQTAASIGGLYDAWRKGQITGVDYLKNAGLQLGSLLGPEAAGAIGGLLLRNALGKNASEAPEAEAATAEHPLAPGATPETVTEPRTEAPASSVQTESAVSPAPELQPGEVVMYHGSAGPIEGELRPDTFLTSDPNTAQKYGEIDARMRNVPVDQVQVHAFAVPQDSLRNVEGVHIPALDGSEIKQLTENGTARPLTPPESGSAPPPLTSGEMQLPSASEVPRPTQLPPPAEANPISDALGVKTRTAQPRAGTGKTPAPIGGGSKIMPEVPSLQRLESSMQSSRLVNRMIRRVPQVGAVARTVFGSAADTSTEPAKLAAAHGALQIAYDNSTEVGLAHVAHDAPMREAFGQPKISDVRATPEQRQYQVTITDKATGQKVSMPINDLLEGDLNKYDLTPAQRDSILMRRQVWQEAVTRYGDAVKALKAQKFRIGGLQEAIDSLAEEQMFPRVVIGRVDAAGKLHTSIGEDFQGSGLGGAVKTSASFKGSRAVIDVYETPDGTRVEVPVGGRVIKDGNGQWQVLTKEDIADLKEADPETPAPKGVQLTRVHQLKTGETAAIPNGSNLYELPDGTRLNMTTAEAREFRKGLPKDQRPTLVETTPFTRNFTTAEMEANGIRYEDPDIALALKLREIGRRTADLELLGSTLAQGRKLLQTKEQLMGRGAKTGVYRFQPAEKFGGQPGDVIDVRPFDAGKLPALKDYYGPTELVKELEQRLGTQRTKLVPVLSELGQDARGLVASGDIGTIGIQLMGSVANDMGNLMRASYRLATGHPELAQRSLTNITGKSIMAKFHTAVEGDDFLSRTLADPNNASLLERWGPYINPPHQSEFSSAAATGHGLAKLPLVGGTFKRLNQMFENALFVSQLEHARALDRIYPNATAADREALGSWIRNSVGTLSMRRLGISPLQQDIESTYLLFAPRYTRSLFAAAGALMKNDIGGQEARLALGSLFAAGTAAYLGVATALGQKPEFNPTKPGFMAVRIGNNWVGIGGGIRTMAHLIATSGDTLFTKPQNFLSPDFNGPRENPILNFWRSRSAPLSGTAIDLFTGEDFRGRPINLATDWPSLLISHGLPFAGQGALEANGNFFTKTGMGLITGLGYRASPLTAYQQYDMYLKDQRDAATGEQRFPDGALTTETATNGFNAFTANDPQAAHLKEALAESRRTGTQSQRDIQAAVDDRNAKLTAAETKFNQDHDYVAFRKADTAIRASSADAMKQLALSSTSSTADKQILNSWFDTYKDPRAVDPVTGNTNPDGIDQVQAEWMQQHPGEYERIVVPNLTQGATPLETQLRKDRQTITALGWWDTDKNAWNTLAQRARAAGINLPADSSEADYIKARTSQLLGVAQARGIPQPELWAQSQIAKDRVIHAFDTIRTRDRLILQNQHPELTVLLARWGYNNVSQKEYGMAVRNLARTGQTADSIY